MPYFRSDTSDIERLVPTEWTHEEKMLKAVMVSAGWLECATFEEYPDTLRAAWRELGKKWLDLTMEFTGPELVFTSFGRIEAFDYYMDKIERLWDASLALDPPLMARVV